MEALFEGLFVGGLFGLACLLGFVCERLQARARDRKAREMSRMYFRGFTNGRMR